MSLIYAGIDQKKKSEKLLYGYFEDDLPHEVPNQIRIFISSTFKDYSLERNYLIKNVYYALRDYCVKQHQKDLFFIDMRWGITDEAANQQLSTKICLDEIEKCFSESIGPSFVGLLSHRYGTRFLQSAIPKNEFELIKIESNVVPFKHIKSLLDFCFQLDENSINNKEYKLKTVDEITKRLGIDEKEWQIQSNNLINCIRRSVDTLYNKQKFTKEQRERYFNSVTEQEIQLGVLNNHQADLKSIVFLREIENMPENPDSVKGFREEEKEQQTLMNNLKTLVEKRMPVKSVYNYTVDWSKSNNFKEPCTDEIKNYLSQFSCDIKESIIALVNQNITALNESIQKDNCNPEILHHSLSGIRLTIHMINRPNLINKIKKYLSDDTNNKPFIITAPSGAGKSTLMAYTAKYLRGSNDIVLLRFMGTSRGSSNMRSVMQSLIHQISRIFSIKQDDTGEIELESTFKLKEKFKNILEKILVDQKNTRILILLDSIDQLSINDHTLDWMLYDLPNNIKMIYSVMNDFGEILNKLKRKIEYNEQNYLTIDALNFNEAKEMHNTLLRNANRKLEYAQQEAINDCFANTEKLQALHVKLLFDISSKWISSHEVPNEFKKCISTKETIKYMFSNLEALHGHILFSRCIFYLTLFEYNGISEAELEDIMSIDDEVLTSVFKHHHPPVRRFPNSLWLFIKYDIKDYVTHKETDDLSVVSWLHRAFIEASKEYYSNIFEESEERDKILENVLDYFTEKWNPVRCSGESGEMKEFKYKKSKLYEFQPHPKGIEKTYLAYRNTKTQVIRFEHKKNNETVVSYNKRKLNELVYVINMLKDNDKKIELLKEHVYFNYEFMLAKAELRKMDFVVDMHHTLLELKEKIPENIELKELLDVSEIYSKKYPSIQQTSGLLYLEVLSRLESRSKYVEKFAKPSGLVLQKRYIENDDFKSIFLTDGSEKIESFYSEHDGPHLFITIDTSEKNKIACLYVINSITTKLIGRVDLKVNTGIVKILLNESNTKIARNVNDLNGLIYFQCEKNLYLSNFDGIISEIQRFDKLIKQFFMFSSVSILVFLTNEFQLFVLDDGKFKQSIESFEDNLEIEIIETNITENVVFSANYFKTVEFVTIIIGLSDKKMNIYRFNTQTNTINLLTSINSLRWNVYEYSFEGRSFIIDNSFLIDNMNDNRSDGLIVKFAIQEEEKIKVVQVDSKGEHSIVKEIDEKMLKIRNEDKQARETHLQKRNIQLEGYSNDRILITFVTGYHTWNVFSYNLNKNEYVQMNGIKADGIYSIDKTDMFIAIFDYLHLYKINEHGISEVFKKKMTYSFGLTRMFMIKNKKFLKIDQNQKKCIDEYDFLTEKPYESQISYNFNLKTIYCAVDTNQILMAIEKGPMIEIVIFDLVNYKILDSVPFDEENSSVISHDNNTLIIFNREVNKLSVYKISMKDNGRFGFNLIFEDKHVHAGVKGYTFSDFEKSYMGGGDIKNWGISKCSHDSGNNKMVVTLFNEIENSIEVRQIEENNTEWTQQIIEIKMDDIILSRINKFNLITPVNKHLVLWGGIENNKNCLYYINMYNHKIIDSFEFECMDLSDFVCDLPNNDNLIVQLNKSICYIELDNENKIKRNLIKEYDTNDSLAIKSEKSYLIVWIWNKEYFEIINLYKFLETGTFNGSIVITRCLRACCISTNCQYLTAKTAQKELIVYRLIDMKQVGQLQVNQSIYEMCSSDQFLSTNLNYNLAIYKIFANDF